MPDRLDRFAATVLTDLVPVDIEALNRRARRRRRSRRGALLAGVGTLMAVLTALIVVPRTGEQSQQVTTRPDDPSDFVVSGDRVGSWREAAEPPFSLRQSAFTTTLSDGRFLFWGGLPWQVEETSRWLPDGAVYDPETDEWASIPSMPLPAGVEMIGPSGGVVFIFEQVIDDKLAVAVNGTDNVVVAGVYDVAAGEWAMAPPQSDIDGFADGAGWDGTTLALTRTTTEVPWSSGGVPGPWTRRWSPGDSSWVEGAPPPLTGATPAGYGAGTDSAVGRLAIWRAVTDPQGDVGSGPHGAIYDISGDIWSTIPDTPLLPDLVNPVVSWRSPEELLVSGSLFSDAPAGETVVPAAIFDTRAGWQPLRQPPITRGDRPSEGEAVGPAALDTDEGLIRSEALVALSTAASVDLHATFLVNETWERAPYAHVAVYQGTWIAVDADDEPGAPQRIRAAVRTAPGRWRPAPSKDGAGNVHAGAFSGDVLALYTLRDGRSHLWVLDLGSG